MKIEPLDQAGSNRTGTLSANITVGRIIQVLGFEPNILDDETKVKYSWGFTLDGERCGIWDYKGARWSFFGSDAALAKLERALDTPMCAPVKVKSKHTSIGKVRQMRAALIRIASYTDEGANEHLRLTGSHGAFDEPSAVKIARQTLESIGEVPE